MIDDRSKEAIYGTVHFRPTNVEEETNKDFICILVRLTPIEYMLQNGRFATSRFSLDPVNWPLIPEPCGKSDLVIFPYPRKCCFHGFTHTVDSAVHKRESEAIQACFWNVGTSDTDCVQSENGSSPRCTSFSFTVQCVSDGLDSIMEDSGCMINEKGRSILLIVLLVP